MPIETVAPAARAESFLGDLAGVVSHDLNNLLNTMLLQVTILEHKGLPDELRGETAVIRQTGRAAAALLKQFQEHLRPERPRVETVDLNGVVRTAAASWGKKVNLKLAAALPPIQGDAAEMARALALLLAEAGAVSSQVPLVETALADERVLSRIGDGGPPMSEDALARFFEPFQRFRPGSDGLRLPIGRALVRRLQGNIRAENRPEGGVVLVVEWRRADTP